MSKNVWEDQVCVTGKKCLIAGRYYNSPGAVFIVCCFDCSHRVDCEFACRKPTTVAGITTNDGERRDRRCSAKIDQLYNHIE